MSTKISNYLDGSPLTKSDYFVIARSGANKKISLDLLVDLGFQVVANVAALPATGNASLLYYAISEGSMWYWNGASYTEIALSSITEFDATVGNSAISGVDGDYLTLNAAYTAGKRNVLLVGSTQLSASLTGTGLKVNCNTFNIDVPAGLFLANTFLEKGTISSSANVTTDSFDNCIINDCVFTSEETSTKYIYNDTNILTRCEINVTNGTRISSATTNNRFTDCKLTHTSGAATELTTGGFWNNCEINISPLEGNFSNCFGTAVTVKQCNSVNCEWVSATLEGGRASNCEFSAIDPFDAGTTIEYSNIRVGNKTISGELNQIIEGDVESVTITAGNLTGSTSTLQIPANAEIVSYWHNINPGSAEAQTIDVGRTGGTQNELISA